MELSANIILLVPGLWLAVMALIAVKNGRVRFAWREYLRSDDPQMFAVAVLTYAFVSGCALLGGALSL